MNLKNIKLDMENLSNGGPIIATDANPAYEYKDGQRLDKVTGLKVSVVFPGNHYDTLTVTVADSMDRLSALLEKGDPVYVKFTGFTARVYIMNGRGGVSAKADSVRVVDDDNDIVVLD